MCLILTLLKYILNEFGFKIWIKISCKEARENKINVKRVRHYCQLYQTRLCGSFLLLCKLHCTVW